MPRTRSISTCASRRPAKVTPPTKAEVRRSRPRMSWRKLEWSHTPARARGCRACSSSALTPPVIITAKSACTRQHTESGPNSPGSPGGSRKFTRGAPAPEVRPITAASMRRRKGSAKRLRPPGR